MHGSGRHESGNEIDEYHSPPSYVFGRRWHVVAPDANEIPHGLGQSVYAELCAMVDRAQYLKITRRLHVSGELCVGQVQAVYPIELRNVHPALPRVFYFGMMRF